MIADGAYIVRNGLVVRLVDFTGREPVEAVAEAAAVMRLAPAVAPRGEGVLVVTSGTVDNRPARVAHLVGRSELTVVTTGGDARRCAVDASQLLDATRALATALRSA